MSIAITLYDRLCALAVLHLPASRIELPIETATLIFSRENLIVLWILAPVALAFILLRLRKHSVQQSLAASFHAGVVRELYASGRVDLADFAETNLDAIRARWSAPDMSLDAATALMTKYVKCLITDGTLKGVVDEEGCYVDRDFVVREQRVTTTNINVQLDFNSLVQQLGNKGVVLTAIQCPQCSASSDVPKHATQFTCTACGTPVRVTDVFERFKAILG